MRLAFALPAVLCVAAAPASIVNDAVDSFHCDSGQKVDQANVASVNAAYGSRSATIVERALAADASQLAKMVSPTATFTLFQGDVGVGPRSTGAQAAIAFAQQLTPTSYHFSVGPGPFSMDPCDEASADLVLEGNKPGEVVYAEFKYLNGVLIEVEASQLHLTRGDFPKPSDR